MTTSIDFSELDPSKIDQWAEALGTLLTDAAECLRTGTGGCRAECMENLRKFIQFNPFQTLDDMAAATVSDLIGASVDAALNSIGQRTASLHRLTKDIQRVSDGANKDAASIRLEALTRALDATTASIRALNDLRDAVRNDAAAADLIAKLEDLVEKTQALRNELERG
jgi:hypothetical protein